MSVSKRDYLKIVSFVPAGPDTLNNVSKCTQCWVDMAVQIGDCAHPRSLTTTALGSWSTRRPFCSRSNT